MVPSLRGLSYPERLELLDLPSLSYRRARGDMIEVFKIITNVYDNHVSNLFKLRENVVTRGSKTRKIIQIHSHTSSRHTVIISPAVSVNSGTVCPMRLWKRPP